jgi:DNA polymerase-4
VARGEPSVLHLDLDAFFASVEQLEHPEHRGRPVVVGGLGPRGVVAAASYEAREFGIHSALPMAMARRACPDAVFLGPRFDAYAAKSREVMAILRAVTPLVEPLSLDEAFLDVAGARRSHGTGPEIGARLRAEIRSSTGLTASVGAATTKLVAKIASDLAKPDGMLVVEPGTELELLHPLPVRRLWGVGPVTQRRLGDLRVRTVGDLAQIDEGVLVRTLGRSVGAQLHALAWNLDDRAVEPERETKSIGHEETFATDRTDRAGLERDVGRMADAVSQRVRAAGVLGRTVQVKLRYHDFTTITRARTLREPTDLAADFERVARSLFAEIELGEGIRLLGISVSQLHPREGVQEQLPFGDTAESGTAVHASPGRRALEHAVHRVRDRFGEDAVGRASATHAGRLRTGRRGSLWGPDDEPGGEGGRPS